MKKLSLVLAIALFLMPLAAQAAEITEEDVREIIESEEFKSSDLAYDKGEAGYKEQTTKEETVVVEERKSSSVFLKGRQGSFRAGLIGPGYAVANKGAGSMMNIGVEGEYFFWENLSALMRIWVATDFDDITILSFLPMVRYVFDLTYHPRWSFYVQGGVGLALYDGEHPAADIAIPGGGFWWQWTDNWSVGADASLHILARDRTAVGFTISPVIRYQF